MNKYKIAIVDDEDLMIKGLKMLLEQDEQIEVVHELHNGQELIDLVNADKMYADIVMLDLSMPVLDGIDTLQELNKLQSEHRVIILSSHYNDSLIMRLLDEGVSGFLPKNANPDELTKTILQVGEKGFYINDHILQIIRQRRFLAKKKLMQSTLTSREEEVIKYLCAEYTTKEIAKELFISPRTVDGHRNKILEKTGSKNIAGIVVYAIEHNLYNVKNTKYQ